MNDLKLMVGLDGRHWIAMPAIPQVDKDRNPRLDANGKQSWSQIIEFTTREATHKFRETALEVMRRQHPEPFNEADP